MSTNYTTYAQHANATITVTNTAELNAALANLSSGGGGTILLDGNGGPYDISGNGVGGANNPILIKAADPNNEPLVQNIFLDNASYITMTQLDVNSVGTGSTVHDLRISSSDHIEFVDNSMTSNANGLWDGSSNVNLGGKASLIRDSSDINFSGNTVADYNMGNEFLEVQGLNYNGNELSGIQGDGFRTGGLQNALIDNNYMHDFYGSLQSLNHTDFIQIWSSNTTLVTSNIEISNNVLDTNGGASSQGIFIGNELTRGGGNGPLYQNIKIHDNVVHTASWHGISIEGTHGAEIYNNSVFLDDQSYGWVNSNSPAIQSQPFMHISTTTGAVVYGNLAGKISVNGAVDTGVNNQLLDYSDPNTAAFIDNFMNNLPAWSGGASGAGGSTSGGTGSSGGTGGSTGNTTPPDTSGGGNTDTSGGSTGSGGDQGGTTTPSAPDTGGSDSTDDGSNDQNPSETENDNDEVSEQTEAFETSYATKIIQESVETLMTKFDFSEASERMVAATESNTVSLEDLLATSTPPVAEYDDLETEEIDREAELELLF